MFRMPMSKKATRPAVLIIAALVAALPSAGPAVELVTRDAWGAKPPLSAQIPHTPKFLTIHHTAVRQNPSKPLEAKLRSLQNFSQSNAKLADGRSKKAWSDVPYHYYIGASGRVAEGREVSFVGDTNTNYNPTGHIAIVVEGNFEVEMPTAAQLRALTEILEQLSSQHNIAPDHIGHHKTHASTLCPGINLAEKLPQVIEAIKF